MVQRKKKKNLIWFKPVSICLKLTNFKYRFHAAFVCVCVFGGEAKADNWSFTTNAESKCVTTWSVSDTSEGERWLLRHFMVQGKGKWQKGHSTFFCFYRCFIPSIYAAFFPLTWCSVTSFHLTLRPSAALVFSITACAILCVFRLFVANKDGCHGSGTFQLRRERITKLGHLRHKCTIVVPSGWGGAASTGRLRHRYWDIFSPTTSNYRPQNQACLV